MRLYEQIDRGDRGRKHRGWIKRMTNRSNRRQVRQNPETALKKKRFRGNSL